MKYEESDRVELKREMIKDLDKEIIAFLNTHGGTIYIGVEDNGNVVGIARFLLITLNLIVEIKLTFLLMKMVFLRFM